MKGAAKWRKGAPEGELKGAEGLQELLQRREEERNC